MKPPLSHADQLAVNRLLFPRKYRAPVIRRYVIGSLLHMATSNKDDVIRVYLLY